MLAAAEGGPPGPVVIEHHGGWRLVGRLERGLTVETWRRTYGVEVLRPDGCWVWIAGGGSLTAACRNGLHHLGSEAPAAMRDAAGWARHRGLVAGLASRAGVHAEAAGVGAAIGRGAA